MAGLLAADRTAAHQHRDIHARLPSRLRRLIHASSRRLTPLRVSAVVGVFIYGAELQLLLRAADGRQLLLCLRSPAAHIRGHCLARSVPLLLASPELPVSFLSGTQVTLSFLLASAHAHFTYHVRAQENGHHLNTNLA